MAGRPALADPHTENTALLRERLRRFAATLDRLDEEQLATIDELVAILERLATLLDETADH